MTLLAHMFAWDKYLCLAERLEMIKNETADIYKMGSMILTVLLVRNVRE
jgi:hypothetical protein